MVTEPGRRIVAQVRDGGGTALPWIDMAAFARRAVALATDDLTRARGRPGPVFFDRGLIDAAVALEHAGGMALDHSIGGVSPYSDPVFLAPPWPELFDADPDRRHGFDAAAAEYGRIVTALGALGHRVLTLPKATVTDRVRFVLGALVQWPDEKGGPQGPPIA